MSAADRHINIFTGFIDCFLFAGDRWCSLEMTGEQQIRTVADSAKDSTGMVRVLIYNTIFDMETVIIIRTGIFGYHDAIPDLNRFYGTNRHKGFGEICI